jgi:hypothetical protein
MTEIRRADKHDRKMRWLGENQSALEAKYPGMWVAISDDGLAGVGKTVEEAEAAAAKKGVLDPLLTGVKRREHQGVHLISRWR